VTALNQISWSFRQNQETKGEDAGPTQLEAHRNAVCSGSVDVERQDVDYGGDKQSHRDGKLVRADKRSSDPFWSHF
jgi:hypothetical protein